MVKDDQLEKYDYDNGSIDELKKKVFSLCEILFQQGKYKDHAYSVAKKTSESDSEDYVSTMLNLVCKYLLDIDDVPWDKVYQILMEDMLYQYGSLYQPKDKEDAEEVVRKCIQERKRIKTDESEEEIF